LVFDKKVILQAFVSHFESELQMMIRAAKHARESATSDEVKSQDKYDTQSIEASYLAGAQEKRAEELKTALGITTELLKKIEAFSDRIVDGSLVVLENMDRKSQQIFFVLPRDGGHKVTVDSQSILSLSSSSPLGESLIGRRAGDSFEFEAGGRHFHYLIVRVG
jgi:transcription elongation GreA/GreB family factor